MTPAFNTTIMEIAMEYLLPIDATWKNRILAACLLGQLPIFAFFFAGKMVLSGFENFKKFYTSVVDFQPYYNKTSLKFIECFRQILGCFWVMFALALAVTWFLIFGSLIKPFV